MYNMIESALNEASTPAELSLEEHNEACQELIELSGIEKEESELLALYANLSETEAVQAHQLAIAEVLGSIKEPNADTVLAVQGWYQQATAPLGSHGFKLQDTESVEGGLADVDMAVKKNLDRLKAAGKKVFELIAKAAKALFKKFTDVFGKIKGLIKKIMPGASKEKSSNPGFDSFQETAKDAKDSMDNAQSLLSDMVKKAGNPKVKPEDIQKTKLELDIAAASAAVRSKKPKNASKENYSKAGWNPKNYHAIYESEPIDGFVILATVPFEGEAGQVKLKKLRLDKPKVEKDIENMSTNERLEACIDMVDDLIDIVNKGEKVNSDLESADDMIARLMETNKENQKDKKSTDDNLNEIDSNLDSLIAQLKHSAETVNKVASTQSKETISQAKNLAKQAIKPGSKKEK